MFKQHKLKMLGAAFAVAALVAGAAGALGGRDTVSAQERGDGIEPGVLNTVIDGFLSRGVENVPEDFEVKPPKEEGARGDLDGRGILVTDQGTGNTDGRVLYCSDNDNGEIEEDECLVLLNGLYSETVGEGKDAMIVGLSEAIVGQDGDIYGVTGGIAEDLEGSASLWNLTQGEVLAYFWPVEEATNPDGVKGDLNSNPFALVQHPSGAFIVSDAGANVLWRVAPAVAGSRGVLEYTIEVYANVQPFAPKGGQAVPTGLEYGPDGYLYGTTLSSEQPGESLVLRYMDPSAGERGGTTVTPIPLATNLTAATDIDFDESGYAIVTEFSVDPSDPEAPGMVSISETPLAPVNSGGDARGLFTTWNPLVDFAVTPTAVAIDDGNVYVNEEFWGFVFGSGFGSRVAVIGPGPEWFLEVGDQVLPPGETTITIASVEMAAPGYVVIHEGDADGFTGTVLGVSEYLEAGAYFDLEVDLDAPPTDGQVVWAMLHTEDNGNETYDGADVDLPVVDKVAGNPDFDGVVVFPIAITVEGGDLEWGLEVGDQGLAEGETTIVIDSVTLALPGYVVIHQGDEDSFSGTVLGVSEYLEAGTHKNVEIDLDPAPVNDQVVWAMVHTEDNGNETYDGASVDLPVVDEEAGNPDFGGVIVFPITLGVGDGDPTWALELSDQVLAKGETTIVIDSVTMAEPGYVAVHEGDEDSFTGTVLGVSAYLAIGTHENVEIVLDPAPVDGQTVWPMLHTEDTGNETYDGAAQDLPVIDEVAGNPAFGGVVVFPILISVEGGKGEVIDLFEGWNPINDWPGPELEGDGITEYFDTNVDGEWDALAYYNTETEMWEQRFQDPPLPSFNTLNVIEPGNDIWIFVPTDATLTISPDGGGGGVQTLEISAEGLAFSTDVLMAEPGEVEVEFTNNAGFPHNFSVYHDEAYTDSLAAGEIISEGTDVVELGELAAGEYYFRCDVHPAQMQGELTVE
jgi:plastocyanin